MILIIDGDTREAISDTCLALGILATLPPDQQAAALEAARQAQRNTPIPAAQASRIVRPGGNGVAPGPPGGG